MFANQRSKRFGKADKTNGKRTVFNCRLNAVIFFKFIAAHVKPLPHQKRKVTHTQVALHAVTVIKLLCHKIHHIVKHLIELVYIAFCFNGKARKVNCCKRKVAAPGGNLLAMAVGNNARTAAHISHLSAVIAVVSGIHKAESRVQALCSHAYCLLEQIIVRVAGV